MSKTVSIAGTSSGLGEATVFEYAQRGWNAVAEFATLTGHIVENGFFNAAAPRLDAGYRVPL